jgi:hypothetical protein
MLLEQLMRISKGVSLLDVEIGVHIGNTGRESCHIGQRAR